jgi:hypothetical protein
MESVAAHHPPPTTTISEGPAMNDTDDAMDDTDDDAIFCGVSVTVNFHGMRGEGPPQRVHALIGIVRREGFCNGN